ncbi:homing endonuclease associated repeat-containing protein [Halobacteriales archaeon Cl-PHB]
MTVSDDDLLDELRSLAEELGEPPTSRDVREQGTHSLGTYRRRFGSWNQALEAAGLEPHRNTGIDDEDIVDEIQRLTDELDRRPTVSDMLDVGKYSQTAVTNRFGNWNEALEVAGFEPRDSPTNVSEAELLEEVQRLADELGRPPRVADVREQGTYRYEAYLEEFDSWDVVLDAAGLSIPDTPSKVPREDLIADLQRVADKIGRPPTQQDIREQGDHAVTTYYNRFGSIPAAREAAGLDDPAGNQDQGPKERISDHDLLNDVRRLAGELDHPPSLKEYREHGQFSATTYYRRFGSWPDTLEAAGFESRDPESKIPTEELVVELQRIAEDVNGRPTRSDMDEQGAFSNYTYKRRFGSWADALEAADIEGADDAGTITDDELLDELSRLAEDLGESPTMSQMDDEGAYAASTYARRFGSWSGALEAADIETGPTPSTVTKADLLGELQRLADELGDQPTSTEMDEHGQYASATYQRHFGSWSAAVETAFADEKS